MGYVLQPNVRVLAVADAVGRVMARSIVRLLLRSDTREPVLIIALALALSLSQAVQI